VAAGKDVPLPRRQGGLFYVYERKKGETSQPRRKKKGGEKATPFRPAERSAAHRVFLEGEKREGVRLAGERRGGRR